MPRLFGFQRTASIARVFSRSHGATDDIFNISTLDRVAVFQKLRIHRCDYAARSFVSATIFVTTKANFFAFISSSIQKNPRHAA
jgi:hypothetical protein